MDTPKVTTAHVRELLNATQEDPVLYVNDEGALEVWAEAYVSYHQIVAHQHEVKDALLPPGADPLTEEAIKGYLPGLQDEVDRITSES